MKQNEAMKYLGELETCAMYQESLILDIKKDLKQQQEELDNLIARMRGIIRDDKTGQETIPFEDTKAHVLEFKQKMQGIVDKGGVDSISISSPSVNDGKEVVIAKKRRPRKDL